MASNWYEDNTKDPLGPVGGGDQGQALVRNNFTDPVTNIAYVQGGWVTVFEDADMLDLPINRVFHGQIVYVSASHKLYTAKRIQDNGPASHSFHPIDLPHEAFNLSSGSLPASLGHLSSSNVFSSSGQFTGTNLTFTGEVTMSNLEIGGHLETDTLSFDGVNFTAVTTDFSDGSTVFGANASGALDPASPQAEDVEPSDLNHRFTGSLLVTGGLEVQDTITLPNNKSVSWPNGSIRVESNTLKLVADTLIDLQDNTEIQGTLTTTGNITAPNLSGTNTGDQNISGIATNATAIAANDTDIAANTAAIAANDIDIASNTAAITSNDTDIATNAAAIASNDTDIATNAAAIASNDTDIATNAAAIASNDTDIATNAAAITSNDTDIAANTANITSNDTDIATNAAAIASNDTDIATNAAAIASNDTDIATNAADITTNAAAITSNDTDIAANTAAITLNDTDIATNTADIATNTAAITSNDTDITALQTSINDINTTTTGITELSYDSLIVSDVDIPLTNTNASPTITDGIVIGGNTTDGQYNFNVQTDNIGLWPDASTHIVGGISTIVNTIDNSDETTTRYNHATEDFNFIFDLEEAKTVSEFRITFAKQDSEYELPENIFIYGKTESFSAGEDDGILLGEGARPGAGGVGVNWSGPSSNPLSLYGIGDQGNLNRTASIAETSLTSSFQYYRVRFQKTVTQEDGRDRPTFTKIANITPVTRNTSTGTSISASNGVLNVNTITTNNLIGTASFANFATTANEAFSSSYALTASYIEGATDVELSDVATDITPTETDIHSLGTPNLKWKDVYAINTFFGGVHEINLKTEGLDKLQEGTVLSLQNGTLYPCKKEADPLVMGIVSKGENYPIILGAEPVLVTGKVEEGDYIITSNIKGHGKGINPQHIYDKQLFGKIIAQAIEKGEGESYTIKAMIRKM